MAPLSLCHTSTLLVTGPQQHESFLNIPLTFLPVTSSPYWRLLKCLTPRKAELTDYLFEESSLDTLYLLLNSHCSPHLSRSIVSDVPLIEVPGFPHFCVGKTTFSPLSLKGQGLEEASALGPLSLVALSIREGVPVGAFRALGIAWAVFSPCGGLQCLKVSHQLCVPSCTSWAQAFYCCYPHAGCPTRETGQYSSTPWQGG